MMKKKQIYLIIAVLFFFLSCEKDKDPFYVAPEMYFESDEISTLAVSETFTLNVPGAIVGTQVTTVTVTITGGQNAAGDELAPPSTDLGTITINSGEGTVTWTAAELGLDGDGASVDLELLVNLPEGPATRTATIYHVSPLSVDGPLYLVDDSDINGELKESTNDTAYIVFNIASDPASDAYTASLTQIVNGGAPTIISSDWDISDTIKVVASDNNLDDEIVYTLTFTAGLTDVISADYVIGYNSYQNTIVAKLDSTTNLSYDLIEHRNIDVTAAGDTADIELLVTNFVGGFNLGFISNENAEFIEVTVDKDNVYDLGDIVATEATNFGGAVTSDTDVAIGDVFIFRTNRSAGPYTYGIMKVITMTKPEGVVDDSYIELEIKY